MRSIEEIEAAGRSPQVFRPVRSVEVTELRELLDTLQAAKASLLDVQVYGAGQRQRRNIANVDLPKIERAIRRLEPHVNRKIDPVTKLLAENKSAVREVLDEAPETFSRQCTSEAQDHLRLNVISKRVVKWEVRDGHRTLECSLGPLTNKAIVDWLRRFVIGQPDERFTVSVMSGAGELRLQSSIHGSFAYVSIDLRHAFAQIEINKRNAKSLADFLENHLL